MPFRFLQIYNSFFILKTFRFVDYIISSLRLSLDKKCYVIALCAIYYIFVVKKC